MNLTLIGYGVAALMVIGLLTGLYFHGKHVEALEGQSTTKDIVLEKAQKNADIATNRPDFNTLVDGVLNHGNY